MIVSILSIIIAAGLVLCFYYTIDNDEENVTNCSVFVNVVSIILLVYVATHTYII